MSTLPGTLLGAAGLGALLALDAAPLAQLLLSQPLPAAVLAGLAFHALEIAAPLGIALQLVWSAVLPLGGSLVPDSGPAVVGGVAAASLAARAGAGMWAAPIGFVTALALGPLGARLVVQARRVNHRLVARAESAVEKGNVASLERAHGMALAVTAARGAVLSTAGATAGLGVAMLLAHAFGADGSVAEVAAHAARWAVPAGVGVVTLAAARRARHGWLLAAAGATAVLAAVTLA